MAESQYIIRERTEVVYLMYLLPRTANFRVHMALTMSTRMKALTKVVSSSTL